MRTQSTIKKNSNPFGHAFRIQHNNGIRPFFTILVLLIGASPFLVACDDDDDAATTTAKIGGRWFTLEVAASTEDRAQGLMNRTEIPDDGGMIFIFKDSRERSFWMKNCLVDMDIIYIDRAHRIVSAHNMKNQPPKRDSESESDYEDRIRSSASYPSRGASQFVIELKAGKIQELRLQRGEKVILDADELKELVRKADDSP